jgi:prolipoprotein diacylglyceryl transferase
MTPVFLADIPSPSRGVIELGPLPLRAYAFCIIIGIVVATLWGNRRFVARGGRPGRVTDITVFAVPFGLVGGRLYHVITDNELYFRAGRNPWKAFAIWDGGLGIWGAIALGAVGAWIGCRYYRVPLSAYADAVAPGVIVAQAIGRLGNYFNQELFGRPTTLPWGLDVYLRTPGGAAGTLADCGPLGGAPEFPTSYIKADPAVLCGTYHPTFLYELLWNLGVAALLVWADRKFRLGRGQVFWLYVAGYTLGRGWIEMLRIDTANKFFGVRINVFTSIVLFVVAVAILVARRNVGREDPASLRGKPSGSDPDDVAEAENRDDAGRPDGDGDGDGDGDTSDVGHVDDDAQAAKVGSADRSRGSADSPTPDGDVPDHRPDA